jgi:hypothetical protein
MTAITPGSTTLRQIITSRMGQQFDQSAAMFPTFSQSMLKYSP